VEIDDMFAGLVYSFLLGNIAATSLLSQHQNLRELLLLPSQTFRSLSVPSSIGND
jgi:hypothetical protein